MIGIVLGVVVGVLTVLIAAHSPAKRAAKVSPATAVSGNVGNTNKGHRTRFIGFIKIDTALGINHAVSARKNLILMTGSFALSIILFFGFSAGLDFAKALSGNDPEKADLLIDAFKKGFEDATKSWGKDLPDISQRTYDAVLDKFDKWKNGSTTEAAGTETEN